MNYFTQMLLTPVRPLEITPRKGRPGVEDTSHMHRAKQDKTTRKYREVMVNRWMTTRNIEEALGYGRGASATWLQQQVDAGLMDKRPAGGEPFNRRSGYEWRWK